MKKFWDKVEKTSTCWYWKGAVSASGFPLFWHGKSWRSAYKIALLLNGKPKSSNLTTSCGTKACVKPAHIIEIKELTLRKKRAEISRKLSEAKINEKRRIARSMTPKVRQVDLLSPEQKEQIRTFYRPRSFSQAMLARKHRVSRRTIRMVLFDHP